ncbi:MAG: excinuclease ABC subunit A, partial [Thermoguttaceae bacterium]|nr:excinuclease ABC subunit A [Thermoguttaceae bacterium]
MPDIIVKGARQHNLRDVDLTLPHNKLICFTGVSGSGKSSLAFDTLYAEGQRRYIESFSSYARQFLGQLQKPDVDRITGLSPSISISQKTGGQNTRSTVGTITEINDFLRVLYARVGVGYCPRCHRPVTAQTKDRIIDQLSTFDEGTILYLLAPVVREQKGEFRDLFSDLRKQGFLRIRADGKIVRLDDDLKLDRQLKHNIEVVIDRLTVSDTMRSRLAESVEQALRVGHSQMLVIVEDSTQLPDPSQEIDQADRKENVLYFSTEYACTSCNISFEPPTPQMFSFNSPVGMCPHCQGLGYIHTFDPTLLVPDGGKSFQQGCVVPLGKWKDLGRWKRHIYQGVSDTLCKTYNLEKNYPLETAWDELDDQVKQAFLWGTGDLHITFTWRSGPSGHKWGGKFEGIIPRMMKQYNESNSKIQIAAMEKYMNIIPCGHCGGRRLNEQASAFKLETLSDSPVFAKQKIFSLPELNELAIVDLVDFFSELKLSPSGHKIA